jgi:sulfur carrier protein
MGARRSASELAAVRLMEEDGAHGKMKVTINGVARELPPVQKLAELLDALAIPLDQGGIAVALNDAVIPRARWDDTPVAEGDRIEIITAAQGG